MNPKLHRFIVGLLALAAIPAGMAYTWWLRGQMRVVSDPIQEKIHSYRGEFINWPQNLKSFSQAFGGKWEAPLLSPLHTRYEIWATIASLGLTLVACLRLRGSWFGNRVILFVLAWWGLCFYSSIITEQRSIYAIAPLLIFALLRIKPDSSRE